MTPRSRLNLLSILPTGLVWKNESGARITRKVVASWMWVDAWTAEKKKMADLSGAGGW